VEEPKAHKSLDLSELPGVGETNALEPTSLGDHQGIKRTASANSPSKVGAVPRYPEENCTSNEIRSEDDDEAPEAEFQPRMDQ
jgi:hypothetical protein